MVLAKACMSSRINCYIAINKRLRSGKRDANTDGCSFGARFNSDIALQHFYFTADGRQADAGMGFCRLLHAFAVICYPDVYLPFFDRYIDGGACCAGVLYNIDGELLHGPVYRQLQVFFQLVGSIGYGAIEFYIPVQLGAGIEDSCSKAEIFKHAGGQLVRYAPVFAYGI